jgi:hypothetical protein
MAALLISLPAPLANIAAQRGTWFLLAAGSASAELAKAGDVVMLKLLLGRILPREWLINLDQTRFRQIQSHWGRYSRRFVVSPSA